MKVLQMLSAKYTSTFSIAAMIEAIDTWLERRLLESLKSSSFFSITADECKDISTHVGRTFNLLPLVGEWLPKRALSDRPACQIH